MEAFRHFLKQEFTRRQSANGAYSLRAFARQLGTSHVVLSTYLSGKRKITRKSFLRLAGALNFSPAEMDRFLSASAPKEEDPRVAFQLLQQDAFAAVSEWYYDAIMELCLIHDGKINAAVVSRSLKIPALQAKLALETLERLEMIAKIKGRYVVAHENTTNILNPDFSSAADRKYQASVLAKSGEALANVPRAARDHASLCLAMDPKDLPEVKRILASCRRELNAYLQRSGTKRRAVYQLQMSFFPLSNEGESV